MISIDVIIANYNNAKFLGRCIDSVLAQTLLPAEIIVIDDASTDDSLQIIEKYVTTGKVTLIRNDKNLGVTASRNLAISQGKSAFLTTLDADDFYYNNNKLDAEAATLIANGKHSIAFSDVIRVDVSGEDMYLVSGKRKIREGDLSFHISHVNGFIPRDYLVSRADYEAVKGYNSNLRIYEDWDLKIRLAKRCKWYFSGEIGTAYRENPKGLSKSLKKEHIETMRKIFWINNQIKNPVWRAIAFARFFFYHSLYMRRIAI